MPIKIQNDLPVKKILEDENIFVMDESRAVSQDIRPLEIAILNLMPLKEDTELDILRVLSNFPIQLEITFLTTATHRGTHVDRSHLNKFYQTFKDVRYKRFDGLIITGAPVEQLEFEEVNYWDELCQIFEWSKTHVYSTFHICWGAQAGLYYHHGIQKRMLPEKLSGVYLHRVIHRKKILMRGMDDIFFVPQSRYTGLDEDTIKHIGNGFAAGMGNMEGTCGAIIGAGIVLGLATKDKAKSLKGTRYIMEKFQERNGATQCKLLKGIGTGKPLRKCPLCVADASQFLEEILDNNGKI